MDIVEKEVYLYQSIGGASPFEQWLRSVKDPVHKNRIRSRIIRLQTGYFGDTKSIESGVFELRLDFGPGFRIYFGNIDNKIILLLCGGDKSSQERDIRKAKIYWLDYKRRLQNETLSPIQRLFN